MKIFISFALLFASILTFAQDQLAPFLDKGKWGYLNQKGEVVIEPQYRDAFPFTEDGMAVVLTMSKQWQYINRQNEAMKPDLKGFIADKKGFHDGLAVVIHKKKKGAINTKGEVVIQPKYDVLLPFSKGYSVARLGNEYLVLDKKGTEQKIDVIVKRISKFTNGLAPFLSDNGKYGFINTEGKVVIEPQFIGVGHFTGDLAWARNEEKKIGYINKKGEWVVKPTYLAAKPMDAKTGLARVKLESGWLFVDKTGKELKVPGVLAFGNFSEGLAWGRNSTKKIGFINTKGEWVIEPSFLAVRKFRNGLCATKEGDKWGFINKKGEWVVKPIYVKVKDFN